MKVRPVNRQNAADPVKSRKLRRNGVNQKGTGKVTIKRYCQEAIVGTIQVYREKEIESQVYTLRRPIMVLLKGAF